MPRFCRPEQKYMIVLDEDKEMPKETRPVFWAKSVSMADHQIVAEQMDRNTADSVGEYFDSNVEALAVVITGWEKITNPTDGIDIEFSVEAMKEVLTSAEAIELIRKALYNDEVKPEEKKS